MNRLFWKILLTFWLSVLLILGAVSLPSWLQQQRLQAIENQVVHLPLAIVTVKAAANTFLYGGREALAQMLREQDQEAPSAMQVYALNAANQELLGRSVDAPTLAAVRAYPVEALPYPVIRTVERGAEQWTLFAPWSGQFPSFQQQHFIRLNKKHGEELLQIGGVLIASFLASAFLAWYFARPVQVLEQGFQALAAGQLSYRVAQLIGKRRDELADLGQGFDQMAHQLQSLVTHQQQLMAGQKRLLQDVSHELRSPLTRLHMSIALARQQPERIAASLERIEQEAERLDSLVGEILTLAKLESGLPVSDEEYVDVLALLEMLVSATAFEATAQAKQVTLQNTLLQDELIIQGNGELLYRALENIIRNAIRHTALHTSVKVVVGQQQGHLSIVIEDRGAGVPEAELDLIFESFRRSSQTANTGGYGLGLAIAQRAIAFHKGSIKANNRPQGGLSVQILLPIH